MQTNVANSGTLVAPELVLTEKWYATPVRQGTRLAQLLVTLTNSGLLQGDRALTLASDSLTNSGLIKGTQALNLSTGALINQFGGTLYSAQNLTLNIPDIDNAPG